MGAKAVLIKGGHFTDSATDLLLAADGEERVYPPLASTHPYSRHRLHLLGRHRRGASEGHQFGGRGCARQDLHHRSHCH
jgi:hypothetical protein